MEQGKFRSVKSRARDDRGHHVTITYYNRKWVSGKAMGNPWGFPHAVDADENVKVKNETNGQVNLSRKKSKI